MIREAEGVLLVKTTAESSLGGLRESLYPLLREQGTKLLSSELDAAGVLTEESAQTIYVDFDIAVIESAGRTTQVVMARNDAVVPALPRRGAGS